MAWRALANAPSALADFPANCANFCRNSAKLLHLPITVPPVTADCSQKTTLQLVKFTNKYRTSKFVMPKSSSALFHDL